MKPPQRTAIAMIAAVTVVAATAGVAWRIHSSTNPVNTATVYAGDLAAAAIAVTLLLALGAWWWKGRRGILSEVSTETQVVDAADHLAEIIAVQWREEAARRRIVTPAPATIRWHWAATGLAAPRREVLTPPTAGTGPAPLPELEMPGKLLESGVVTRLHDQVYARLPHGKLVLLGGPGAGKTGAMILLLLAALDRRATMTVDQRRRVPVPVWLTLGGWNPMTTPLRDWAVDTMNRDHPSLRAPGYGPRAARQLVDSGRIALFLDGLDELSKDMRTRAVERINHEGRALRIVITSRREEYRNAVLAGSPDNCAVIELSPVQPAAAATYLLRDQTGISRQRWEKVGAYLRQHPASVIARALNNPLNLSLARDTYTNKDSTVLIASPGYDSVAAVQKHLIEQALITAYPDEEQRLFVTRRLAWIAHHMGSSRDLPWWDIRTWVPRRQILLARVLVAGLIAGIGGGLVEMLQLGLQGGIVVGLSAAFVAGAATLWIRFDREPNTLIARWPQARELPLFFGTLLSSMLTCSFATGLTSIVIDRNLSNLKSAALYGLIIGVAVGLVIAVARLWFTPIADSRAATPRNTYRADRLTSITSTIIGALLLGSATWIASGHLDSFELGYAFVITFTAVPVIGFAAGQTPLVKLAELVLVCRGYGWMHFARLLNDASERQLLRQAGAVYQFRHAGLQDYLDAIYVG